MKINKSAYFHTYIFFVKISHIRSGDNYTLIYKRYGHLHSLPISFEVEAHSPTNPNGYNWSIKKKWDSERLSTRNRTMSWGCIQPCLLCGERDETLDHLFSTLLAYGMIWCCGWSSWDRDRPRLDGNDAENHHSHVRHKKIHPPPVVFQSTIYYIERERMIDDIMEVHIR